MKWTQTRHKSITAMIRLKNRRVSLEKSVSRERGKTNEDTRFIMSFISLVKDWNGQRRIREEVMILSPEAIEAILDLICYVRRAEGQEELKNLKFGERRAYRIGTLLGWKKQQTKE